MEELQREADLDRRACQALATLLPHDAMKILRELKATGMKWNPSSWTCSRIALLREAQNKRMQAPPPRPTTAPTLMHDQDEPPWKRPRNGPAGREDGERLHGEESNDYDGSLGQEVDGPTRKRDGGDHHFADEAPARGGAPKPSSRAMDWRGFALDAWVDEVDGAKGFLRQYVTALNDNYDTVEQVIDLHLQRDQNFRPHLDTTFYETIAVSKAAHRALFDRWVDARL
eukprot:NODE_19136_length_858_cov_5.529412.p1 GENE.NODE_19136_length_858_cov_5.529412~~NODE_19136_length_858_cov_5.529412.p1  ORF type:complete len:228 (-),score=63.15 NODE_19136_length_858_cov_5.529412:173-856(-)